MTDIKDLKDGMSIKIADHEKRLGYVELTQSRIAGSSQGMKSIWGYILAGVMALVALATFILPRLK